MIKPDLEKQLEGFELTTAHILYRMPDFPAFLQTYIWQDYDKAPNFPVLTKFIDFWTRELDGPIHSVRIVQKGVIGAARLDTADAVYTIH